MASIKIGVFFFDKSPADREACERDIFFLSEDFPRIRDNKFSLNDTKGNKSFMSVLLFLFPLPLFLTPRTLANIRSATGGNRG